MGLLGKLVLKMSADSADFERNMKKARRSAKRFGNQTKQAAEFAAKGMGAAGVAVAAAGVLIVKANLASIDSLAKTADKLGMTTEALAGMRHAAELTGVSQGSLDKSMSKMARSFGEAKTGIGTAKDYLDQMGLSAAKLAAMKPERSFAAISEEINKLATNSDKAAAAQAIFGRAGGDLLNTMKLGADGLAKTAAEAETLGLALSRVDAAQVEAANDAMTRMNAGAAGFGKTLTVAVAPYIKAIADELTAASLKSDGFRDQIASAMEFATKGVVLLGKGFYGLELVWDALKYSFLSMERFIQEGLRQIGAGALAVLEMANIAGIFDSQVAAGQEILAVQAQIVAQIEADQEAVLAAGAKTLTQYDELEGKVLAYKAVLLEASQTAAEEVAANAPGAAVADLGAAVTSAADASKYAGKLAALESYLATEDERLFNAAVARAEMVTAAHESGLISETRQNELLQAVAADHEAKLTEVAKQGMTERQKFQAMSMAGQAKDVAGALVQMTASVAKENKAMFAMNKAASIATAIMNTYEGATKALAKYPGPIGWAMAAATVATGLAQVSQIASTSFGSGPAPSTAAVGASGTVETVDPLVNQAPQQQTTTVIIQGNVIGEQDYIDNTIIPGINDALSRQLSLGTAAA